MAKTQKRAHRTGKRLTGRMRTTRERTQNGRYGLGFSGKRKKSNFNKKALKPIH